LFGLSEEEPVFQKRILSVISGAILPLVSLGFIKALVDYIRPNSTKEKTEEKIGEIQGEEKIEEFTESIESREEIEEEKIENIDNTNKSRRLKDTVYYDLDPTKIT
jgi:hypothetical protein